MRLHIFINGFLSIFLSITLFVFANYTNISAQTIETQKAEFPATSFGNVVQEFFKLIEKGSETEIKSFIQNNFSKEGIRTQNLAETVFILQKLREQSGGLEILSVTPPNGPYGMTLKLKSKRGDNYVQIAVGEDSREPGKIIGFGIRKLESQNANSKFDWSEKKLSESEMIKEIKRQIEQRASDGIFSGVVLIAKDDKILLHTAQGLAERSFNVPNKLDTKFNLASVGKMFTATAIAQLVKQGKISYEDKLIKHLPDFPSISAAEKITIHQLLTHSAGLGTLFDSPGYEKLRRYRSSWDEISAFADEPLFFEPGEKWRYSNAGYVTLGAVIERVSGMNYVNYIRENVFKPLGMNDSGYPAHDEVVKNMSVLYIQSPDDPLGIEPYVADHILAGFRGNAEGGGYSNSLDLFKFARSYRTGKLLDVESQRILDTPKLDQDGSGKYIWGYGIRTSTINGESVRGHSGGGRTDLQMLWDSGYTIIVQTNTVPPSVTALSNEIIQFITKQNLLRSKKQK